MSLSSFARPAWRSLRRSPAFTITASVTLVLGLAATIAVFALVNGVLLRPLPYGKPDRLVGLWNDLPGVDIRKANQTTAIYFTYVKLAKTLRGVGLSQTGAVNVSDPSGAAGPRRVAIASVTRSILPVLEVSPILGRNFSESEDSPNGPLVAIISENLWRSQYNGSRDVLGKTIEINGRARTIVGVMPQRFRFPSNETQLWLPLQLDEHAAFPGGFNFNGVARLAPGATLDAVDRELASLMPRMAELFPNMAPKFPMAKVVEQTRIRPFAVPLKDDVVGDIARTLWIVAAATGLVLLVTCANVTNLILVRTDARQRELAVREAIGAGKARVLAHFFAESAIITCIAGALALGLAALAIRTLVAAGPTEIPRLAELHIDASTIAFAIVLAVLVAFICSVIPALRIGRAGLYQSLREGGRGGTSSRAQQRVRGTLVAAQIALALVALASSGLLIRTFQRLNAVRPGFSPDGVATFWIALPRVRYETDTAITRFYSDLAAGARALPGVQAAGVSSHLPLISEGQSQDPFYPEGDATWASKIPPLQIYTAVDGEYFKTMGIPIIAGRTFDRLGSQRADEAIISQATAIQFWKDSTGRAAIGKRFHRLPSEPWVTIVGVVGSVRDTSLAAPPAQAVYFAEVPAPKGTEPMARSVMALVVRTAGDPAALTVPIQRAVKELDPTLPLFRVRSMSDALRASMAQLSFTIIILGAAALVTLVLGAIGLYGVMAYVVTLRTRELGVRIALGQSPGAVVAMLTRQGVAITVAGVAGGLVLFVPLAQALRAVLFGVAPTDPVTLVSASVLLVIIAGLASWIPARRTARLDPAAVLKAE